MEQVKKMASQPEIMERRRLIHEQIKLTKLNKLTVKQGDQNVTLNLKVDLLDPSIPIADKVLGMLEAYISKQQTVQPVNQVQPAPESPKHDAPEPVRTVEEPRPPVAMAKVDDQTLDVNNASEESNICRLCGQKCPTERSLYEHVSRIHGGKSSAAPGGPRGREEFDTGSNDESEDPMHLNEDDESNLSSSSDHAHKTSAKSRHQTQKRLNVAIRVAKVAYLNNKLDTNPYSPALKTPDLFFPNGFRGNFFSQERLPLRSCSIKMKLSDALDLAEPVPKVPKLSTEPEMSLKEELESHLINRVEFSQLNCLERNISEFVSTNRLDRTRVIPSDKEIRDFFKSLITYIPLNETTRLGDLIKRNESNSCLDSPAKARLLNRIHELILDAKQFGITVYDLKKVLPEKTASIDLIKSQLSLLTENNLVLAVGVTERVYVAFEFKEHWVIKSYKNLKGRGTSRSMSLDTTEEEDEALDPLDQDETSQEPVSTSPKRSLRRYQSSSKVDTDTTAADQSHLSGQCKQVCLVPRPWRYIDGLLNRPVLKRMLESIVLHLKTYPSSTLESLSGHFSPALQPIMTLELVEMLERLKCVEKIVLKAENECNLFSDFTNGSSRSQDDQQVDGNELMCFTCTQESIFILKKLFPND